jgi:flagellar biosynthesis protein FlhF
MRLKTYDAPSMAEAMKQIRAELGRDAIIVSSRRGPGGKGVRVTAALEPRQDDEALIEKVRSEPEREPVNVIETLRQSLVSHGTPHPLVERLVRTAHTVSTTDPVMALAGAFDGCFAFAPLPTRSRGRPIMLVGPPGTGKTLTVAKLATRAHLTRQPVNVITTDIVRAGAVEQIAAFTRILGIDLQTARDRQELKDAIAATEAGAVVLIDTPGANPFDDAEMARLEGLVGVRDMEAIFVLAAGGDPLESAEIATAFGEAGARRMLVTRLDMARRYGGLLAAADAAGLMIGDVGIGARVADGLKVLNPVSLARLVVPDSENGVETLLWTKAAS